MNEPEYILIDELRALSLKLGMYVNFQHGYKGELDTTLQQDNQTEEFASLKYPLLWVVEPIKVIHGGQGWYGRIENLRIILIQQNNINDKAATRLETVFKAILFPIRRSLFKQLDISPVFDWGNSSGLKDVSTLEVSESNVYYWGDDQSKILSDTFDCIDLNFSNLKINNNPNCIIN